jgi:hypothetical protein
VTAAASVASPAPNAPAQLERPAAAPGAPLLHNIELSAGAGALARAFSVGTTDLGAWFAAHAGARLGSRFRAGLLAGFSTVTTRELTANGIPRGTLSGVPFAILAEGGVCGTLGIELCGSAVAGIRGEHGYASGNPSGPGIYQTGDAWLIRTDLGVLARAQWRSSLGLFVVGEVWAAFPLGGGAFTVEGITSASTPLPLLDVTASLQVGWSWQIL